MHWGWRKECPCWQTRSRQSCMAGNFVLLCSTNSSQRCHCPDYECTHVQDSILFFTFYLHLQKLGLGITFALKLTFCAFLCCKVLTAQTAFGAKNERLYNKYYPLCVHRKWSLSSFPRGHTILALLWHSTVTPQWGRAMLYMSWREMPQNANISSQGCQKSFPLGCVFPSAELRNVKKINELYYLYFPSRWEGNRKNTVSSTFTVLFKLLL